MDTLLLTCSACNTEFFPSKNPDFTLKCGHFRCNPCTLSLNPCELDGTKEKLDIHNKIGEFTQKYPEVFNLTCELHKSLLECYCKTCEVLICYRCILTHRNHEVLEESQLDSIIPSITQTVFSYISSVLQEYNQNCLKLKSLKNSIKDYTERISRLDEDLLLEIEEKRQEINKQMDYDFEIFYKVNFKALKKCVAFCSGFQDFKNLINSLAAYIEKKNRVLKEPKDNTEFLLLLPQLQFDTFSFEFISLPSTQFVKYTFSQDSLAVEELRYISNKCK